MRFLPLLLYCGHFGLVAESNDREFGYLIFAGLGFSQVKSPQHQQTAKNRNPNNLGPTTSTGTEEVLDIDTGGSNLYIKNDFDFPATNLRMDHHAINMDQTVNCDWIYCPELLVLQFGGAQ